MSLGECKFFSNLTGMSTLELQIFFPNSSQAVDMTLCTKQR